MADVEAAESPEAPATAGPDAEAAPDEAAPDEAGPDEAAPDVSSLEEQLRKEKEALELQLVDSQKAMAELRKENDALSKGAPSSANRSWVLDIAIGECEFASAFAYFLEVQLDGHAEKRCTDVSPPSERPVFTNSSLLLSVNSDFAEEKLQVSAFLNVVDPSGSGVPAAKLLGTGLLSLNELKVAENATTSKRLIRNVSFTRTAEAGEGKHLVVGRATIVMQVKTLSSEPPACGSDQAHTVASAVAPSLDKTLWQTRPFESRLHVLVHRADALPVPDHSSHAVVRVAARLLQPGGHVLQELASRSLPVDPVTASQGEVWFNQEIVLPLPALPSGLQVGLALEMVSATPDGAVTNALLNLQWSPTSLPPLSPVHLHARASSGSTASRPRPGLLVSLTHEPGHEALDGLAGGVSHGLEIRVHGIPHGRPLPDLVEGALVAVCPESSIGLDTRDLRVPLATYLYDQRVELSAFFEEHFRSSASQLRCFLTPLAGASRTPQWGQFLLRSLSSAAALKAVALLLFECRGVRADPDAPLSGSLLGFASLDASSLVGSTPMSRSFLLDLRLLEAPGASTSLEVEARVWPRGGAATDSPARPLPASSAIPSAGMVAQSAALDQEAKDFRLNHELSVQLSKEFNLRAAALKRAGEEIVALRRQLQLLKNENKSLRAQVEEEEKLAQEVQHRPPPEGLEKLSAAELAVKLQRTLEKYREEKAKASELARRMEDALKEVNRARGLERSLEELQQVHLEQNRELQRLQDEGRKLETYRQTAKTQEKVISKLEKILESSLQEVQKAQKVQVDIERLKTENLKLRERCSSLLTRKKQEIGDDEAQELRQRLAEKDAEITRLQKMATALKASTTDTAKETVLPSPPPETALSAEEQEQLAHLEAQRFDWEQRCAAAEQRLQMLQQQLTDSSKRYGAELSSLEVEIAKKDARIKELEYLQRHREAAP